MATTAATTTTAATGGPFVLSAEAEQSTAHKVTKLWANKRFAHMYFQRTSRLIGSVNKQMQLEAKLTRKLRVLAQGAIFWSGKYIHEYRARLDVIGNTNF